MNSVAQTPKYLHMVRTNMQGYLRLVFCLPYSCCNTSFCNPSSTFNAYSAQIILYFFLLSEEAKKNWALQSVNTATIPLTPISCKPLVLKSVAFSLITTLQLLRMFCTSKTM